MITPWGASILTVWLDLALLDSSLVTLLIHASGSMESRRACSSPSFQSSTLRRKRVYFPSEVTPVPVGGSPVHHAQA